MGEKYAPASGGRRGGAAAAGLTLNGPMHADSLGY